MYEGLTTPELGPRTRRAEFVDPEIESRISGFLFLGRPVSKKKEKKKKEEKKRS